MLKLKWHYSDFRILFDSSNSSFVISPLANLFLRIARGSSFFDFRYGISYGTKKIHIKRINHMIHHTKCIPPQCPSKKCIVLDLKINSCSLLDYLSDLKRFLDCSYSSLEISPLANRILSVVTGSSSLISASDVPDGAKKIQPKATNQIAHQIRCIPQKNPSL